MATEYFNEDLFESTWDRKLYAPRSSMVDVKGQGPGAAAHSDGSTKQSLDGEPEPPLIINIMGDPRIYRGSVYGRRAVSPPGIPPPTRIPRSRRIHRPKLRCIAEIYKSNRWIQENTALSLKLDDSDVQVERPFQPVPLHLFLEEQDAPTITFTDQSLQTDAFRPIPPDRPYIPAKLGMDISTQVGVMPHRHELLSNAQVDPESGDLFNFDVAIKPTVWVIVNKTIEQALLEVRVETELAHIAGRKRAVEQVYRERKEAAAKLERQDANDRAETVSLVKYSQDKF